MSAWPRLPRLGALSLRGTASDTSVSRSGFDPCPPRRAALTALWRLTVWPAATLAEPLLTRNQNPLTLPYGLPLPLPARLPGPGPAAMRSTSTGRMRPTSSRRARATSRSTRKAWTYDCAWNTRSATAGARMIELPWRDLSGGTLDGFIENWHDFFGLPEGPRDAHAEGPAADRIPGSGATSHCRSIAAGPGLRTFRSPWVTRSRRPSIGRSRPG